MRRELRGALRSLARSPGFVIVTVLSLGLGLGLSTTMFALLDAVTHPVLTWANAGRLVEVQPRYDRRRADLSPLAMYQELRGVPAFEAVLPVVTRVETVEAAADARLMTVARVPARFFDVAGMGPLLGRPFGPAEEAEPVAVISHDLWKHALAGRRDLDSLAIVIGGRPFAVVGVLPPGQSYPAETDVWLPQSDAAALAGTGFNTPRALTLLRQGATADEARLALQTLARRLDAVHRTVRAPFAFKVTPAKGRSFVFLELHAAMVAAAVVVLLIACANLANLTLARGLARRRELAVRLAIGATRSTVIREQLAESLLLAAVGGVLGAVLAVWGGRLLTSAMPREMLFLGVLEPRLSWRVFAFGLLAAAASVTLFGLLPAVRVVSGVSLDEPLKEASAATTGRVRRRYSTLVIAEVALALILLMGAGVLLRQVRALMNAEYSFAARDLLRSSAYLPDRAALPRQRVASADADLAARLRTLPGVRDVAFDRGVELPGHAVGSEAGVDSARAVMMHAYHAVSTNFVRTLGLTLLAGRDFLEGEGDAGQGSAIVTRAAAEALYPGGAVVGRMIQLGARGTTAPWVRVVGVVDEMQPRRHRLQGLATPTVYVVRSGLAGEYAELAVRLSRQEPSDVVTVRHAIAAAGWRMNGSGSGGLVEPYLFEVTLALRIYAFLDRVFATMAISALGLAAVGIYGVLMYGIGRRMREFGVRMALGASPANVGRLVVRDVVVMVLAGTAIGGLVALGAVSVFDDLLMDIAPTDALTLVVSEICVAATAFAACAGPTLRAMRSNPLEILRAN